MYRVLTHPKIWSPWTHERKYGVSKTKFRESIVYYMYNMYNQKKLFQLNLILFHIQMLLHICYFHSFYHNCYFAHFILTPFGHPKFVYNWLYITVTLPHVFNNNFFF